MSQTALGTALVPAALVLLMLGLGLSLEVADFRRVLGCPRALAGGLGGQFLLLPAFGILVARGSGLDETFAIGIVVLSLCPGGALSNAICLLVRADVALSVSLTACSSLVTPFTIPLLYSWSAPLWAPAGPALELPLAPTIVRLVAVAIVPIAVGMAIRGRYRRATARLERPVRVFSVILFLGVVAVIVAQNLGALQAGIRSLGAWMLTLSAGATAIGFLVAALIRLPRAATVTRHGWRERWRCGIPPVNPVFPLWPMKSPPSSGQLSVAPAEAQSWHHLANEDTRNSIAAYSNRGPASTGSPTSSADNAVILAWQHP